MQKGCYGNWCPEIYRGLFVDRVNDDRINIAPCCQAETSQVATDQFEFHSDSYLSELRQKFGRGERASECHRCWRIEDNGGTSRRMSAIGFYNVSRPDQTVVLQGLDYSPTWACNLACVMCGPYSSSTWAKELNLDRNQLAAMGKLYQKRNDFADKLDLSSLKKLHLNGGEPLLNDDQLDLLIKLDNLGVLSNMYISYNTNGTCRPSDRLIELWSKAPLVTLFFSIDAVGDAFEYVRWPAKWNEVEQNIVWMKQNLPSNVRFAFNVTVGSYNLLEIVDVYKWFFSNLVHNGNSDQSDFNWQPSNDYDVKYLPERIKLQAIESLHNIPGLLNYVQSMLATPIDDSWIYNLTTIDQRRGTDWKNALKVGKYY